VLGSLIEHDIARNPGFTGFDSATGLSTESCSNTAGEGRKGALTRGGPCVREREGWGPVGSEGGRGEGTGPIRGLGRSGEERGGVWLGCGEGKTRGSSPFLFIFFLFNSFPKHFSKDFLNRILRANIFQQKSAAQLNKDAPA